MEEATTIFNSYHNELYKDITKMRDNVLDLAIKNGQIPLGLGCSIHTSDPEKEIRTIFNSCSQIWAIITLLTINKLHSLIDKEGLNGQIEVVSSIYDSIYLHVCDDAHVIQWLNNTIIPILTTDIFTDTIVHNEAEGEIGYNWYDVIGISNNASIDEIEEARIKAKQVYMT